MCISRSARAVETRDAVTRGFSVRVALKSGCGFLGISGRFSIANFLVRCLNLGGFMSSEEIGQQYLEDSKARPGNLGQNPFYSLEQTHQPVHAVHKIRFRTSKSKRFCGAASSGISARAGTISRSSRHRIFGTTKVNIKSCFTPTSLAAFGPTANVTIRFVWKPASSETSCPQTTRSRFRFSTVA